MIANSVIKKSGGSGNKMYGISYTFGELDEAASQLVTEGTPGDIISVSASCFLPTNTGDAEVETVNGTIIPANITTSWVSKWYTYEITFVMPSEDVTIHN